MAEKKRSAQPYDFTPAFERSVAYLSCSSQRFFGLVGHALEPDGMTQGAVRLALLAAQAIAREVGHGPSNLGLVLQQVRSMQGRGQVTPDEVAALAAMLRDAAEDEHDEAEVAALVRATIQKRLHHEAVVGLMDSYNSAPGDAKRSRECLDRMEGIGRVDISLGTPMAEARRSIDSIHDLERLSLGIQELDMQLGGGPPRGTESVVISSTGGGKSMMMNTVCANALLLGRSVLYATLELPVPWVMARLKAALTGVPINSILNGHLEEASLKLDALLPRLGRFWCQEFPAGVATPEDLFSWVELYRAREGIYPDLLVIDYGDKIRADARKEENGSAAFGRVFEKFRLFAHEHSLWVLTACQSRNIRQTPGTKKKKADRTSLIEKEDVADSVAKIRVADLVVTLTSKEDGVIYKVGKYRYGQGDSIVGPLPHDWECGRMVPVLQAANLEPVPF